MVGLPQTLIIDDDDVLRHGLAGLAEQLGASVTAELPHTGLWAERQKREPAEAVLVGASAAPRAVAALARVVRGVRGAPVLAVIDPQFEDVGVDAPALVDLLRTGVRGALLRTEVSELLGDALRLTARDGAYVSPACASLLLDVVAEGRLPQARPDTELSDRELELIPLITAGLDNGQIAERLGIAFKTAKNHVSNIIEKLGMENRVQVAVWAVRSGLDGEV